MENQEQINSTWSLEKCFETLRHDPRFHLGLGDIRITQAMQEEIARLVERQKIEFAIRELMWANVLIPFEDKYAKDCIYEKSNELKEKLSKL